MSDALLAYLLTGEAMARTFWLSYPGEASRRLETK